jgi:hypothetical protein
MWKSFKNRQNDKKLLPRLHYLSYSLMILGVVFYLYTFLCDKVPSGLTFYGPDWGIVNGTSFSENLDAFTLSDKEAKQLYIIAPFFIALGSLLKLLGVKRDER